MKAYRYRSPVFGRLFWGAFLTSILVLTGVTFTSRVVVWELTLLAVAAGLLSWLFAFLLSRPVDREISRSREFAGSLLDDPADLAGAREFRRIRGPGPVSALVWPGKPIPCWSGPTKRLRAAKRFWDPCGGRRVGRGRQDACHLLQPGPRAHGGGTDACHRDSGHRTSPRHAIPGDPGTGGQNRPARQVALPYTRQRGTVL